jgi:hypothetical protein
MSSVKIPTTFVDMTVKQIRKLVCYHELSPATLEGTGYDSIGKWRNFVNRETLLETLASCGFHKPSDSPFTEYVVSGQSLTTTQIEAILAGCGTTGFVSVATAGAAPVKAKATAAVIPAGFKANRAGILIPDDLKEVAGLFRPAIDPDFKLTDDDRAMFKMQIELARDGGKQMNVLMKGPQGCGKTSKAMQFAAHAGLPVLKEICPLKRETRDWFGYKTASAGSTQWVETQFVEVVRRGYCVIVLDELTRCAPPVLNSMLPLLDDSRIAFVEEIKDTLEVGPFVFFYATANVGAQFTGAYSKIDAALEDRFGITMECDFLPFDQEIDLLQTRCGISAADAKKHVEIAQAVRSANSGMGGSLTQSISTRTLINAATLFKKVGPKAFSYSVLTKFSKDNGVKSERAQVMQFVQAKYSSF